MFKYFKVSIGFQNLAEFACENGKPGKVGERGLGKSQTREQLVYLCIRSPNKSMLLV